MRSNLKITPAHRRAAALAAVVGAVVAASPAAAQTASSPLEVSATVTANCTATTTPVAFGNVDVTSGAAVDGTGGLAVVCTSGTSWDASADVGTGAGASLATRKMDDGSANFLNYALYTDSARTSVWGDGVGGTTSLFSGIGSGGEQLSTIYARVPAGQTSLPAGSYADTVTVTVSY
jgi:spore coat protein U-like protein